VRAPDSRPDDRELIATLRGIVGAHAVLDAAADMASHLEDWRGRYRGAARCVIKPGSTAETAAVVGLLAGRQVPIVPQGGNTGLCGGATPDASGRAVVLNLSRLNRIRALDPINDTVTVEAGCPLERVQQAAHEAGRLFPLSLASQGSCEIGGNLATNAGGVHVLRYGTMRDLTLGLEVVLPDGRVWDGLRGLRKDNTGYDLKHLFIGAEGTLGIITAAVLKLHAAPRAAAVAWTALATPRDAVDLFARLHARFGDRIAAFELIGRSALDLVLSHVPGSRDPFGQPHPWYALIELADTLEGVELGGALEQALARDIERGAAADAVVPQSQAQAQALWALRENIAEAQRIEGFSIKHDISVPVSRVPDLIERAGLALAREFEEVRVVAFGHLGDGNIHYNLSRPDRLDNAAFLAQTERANRIVHDIVHALGGSISAEHGLGQLKRDEVRRYKSEVEMEMMRAIKRCFDPHGLMNPGKLL
jgi:FAD/FMN-containing dehydrogenase